MRHNVCVLFWLLAKFILQTTHSVPLQQTGLRKHHTSISTAAGAAAHVHCHGTSDMHEDKLTQQKRFLVPWTPEMRPKNRLLNQSRLSKKPKKVHSINCASWPVVAEGLLQ